MIDGRLFPVTLFANDGWSTSGEGASGSEFREFVLSREPQSYAAMRAFLMDFEQTIAAEHRRALLASMVGSGMDVIGADFGFTEDGRLVVFEMNANMMFLFGETLLPHFPYGLDADTAIKQALSDLIRTRIESGRANRRS